MEVLKNRLLDSIPRIHFVFYKKMLSQWDLLPSEIQCYILDLKQRQERLDMITNERKELCARIRLYHQAKLKWTLGHVKCRPFKCFVCNGMKWYDKKVVFKRTVFHAKVIECYDDREIVLGNSLLQVMDFMEDIKENLMIFLLENNGCEDQDQIKSRN